MIKLHKLLVPSTFLLIAVASCTPDAATSSSVEASLSVSINQENVWKSANTPQTRAEGTVYALYLFDPSGTRLFTKASPMNDSNGTSTPSTTFNQILSTGQHTFYGVTGWESGVSKDYMSSAVPTTTLPLSLTDIHVGTQTFNVTDTIKEYKVQVQASPIMSKLELVLTGVPKNITSITATLSKQASSFTLTGTVSGNSNTQELTFTQGTKAADGSYTWATDETLIYPVSDDCTSMPITITCSDDATHQITFHTTSSTLCKQGTRIKLTAAYTGISATAGITENAWGNQTGANIDLDQGTIK